MPVGGTGAGTVQAAGKASQWHFHLDSEAPDEASMEHLKTSSCLHQRFSVQAGQVGRTDVIEISLNKLKTNFCMLVSKGKLFSIKTLFPSLVSIL